MKVNSTKIIIGSAILLVVACLVFAIYTVLRVASPFINTSQKIDVEIAKIKAKGEPVTLSQLAQPPVPDNENAAIIYDKAFHFTKTPEGKKDFEIIGEFVSRENGKRDAKQWAKAREAVARNKEIISLIEEAQKRPNCRFSMDWSKGLEAEFPHLSKLRDLSRYLCADSLINASNGNMNEAVDSLLLQIRLLESIKNEHCLIPLLVKISITRIICRSVYETLSYGKITEVQAEKIYNAISEIEYGSDLGKALQGERVIYLSFYKNLREANFNGSKANKNTNLSSQRKGRNTVNAIFGSEEVYYLRNMAKQIRNADLCYREAKIKGIDKESNSERPKYAFFSDIYNPVFSRARGSRDTAIAELAGIQTLLACQAYRDRYHGYPQTLGELRIKIGWKLPKDVFSGRDMIYKPHNGGFILYSVGSDLKDNGGHQPKEFRKYKDGDDIVWKLDK